MLHGAGVGPALSVGCSLIVPALAEVSAQLVSSISFPPYYRKTSHLEATAGAKGQELPFATCCVQGVVLVEDLSFLCGSHPDFS